MKNKFITPILITIFILANLSGCVLQKNANNSTDQSGTPISQDSQVPTKIPVSEIPATAPSSESSQETGLSGKSSFDFSQELQPLTVSGIFQFAEGPVTDSNGNVYFSDITAGKIYKWLLDGSVIPYIEGLNAPNGLALDTAGNLIVCEGGRGRLILIDPLGIITVLADQYNGLRFNEPNDLWIDQQGGIYFTDPAYNQPVVQEGEDVYYITPDRSQVIRVINHLIKPNGIVGSADGKKLYVADWGAKITYAYDVNPDATLTNPQMVIPGGSDGMILDQEGNIYLTSENKVKIYDVAGNLLREIPMQENPTNLTFAGTEGNILFITARTAVYTVQFLSTGNSSTNMPNENSTGFTLTSPDILEGGTLPVEYTCDGVSSTLALNWSGAPAGTVEYAVLMDHIASPTDIHWYWVVYNIPADVTSLPKNNTGIGTLGTNGVNDKLEYAPPCSKGPGFKTYTYTVFALSAVPQFSVSADQVDRAALLEAIKDSTLASASLNVIYSRP